MRARQIHAQTVLRGIANPGFRVDSAGKVIVQVRAFRHAPEKRFEVERIRARGFVRTGRALLGCSRRRGGFFGHSLGANEHRQDQEEAQRSAEFNDRRRARGNFILGIWILSFQALDIIDARVEDSIRARPNVRRCRGPLCRPRVPPLRAKAYRPRIFHQPYF